MARDCFVAQGAPRNDGANLIGISEAAEGAALFRPTLDAITPAIVFGTRHFPARLDAKPC
jgi:hypothetical protein